MPPPTTITSRLRSGRIPRSLADPAVALLEEAWRSRGDPTADLGYVRATRYEFENIEVDVDRYELRRDGRPVDVERQVFDVLLYLIAHRDRVVPKTELLDQVWGDRFVGESALASRVKAARRAVGDDGSA